ncbi:UDP-N-acetylmuramoyl-L-alanyl-D-glutamate--2,6-diaminopimelate ligase [Candidatus Microgenomates bacterium]|nr:UDP-N-acetylmuramoyl-L-alanyl-D-glutamate--2,6-diaminopimelate ligase [Candidatus Microgenomates bacterium]
MIKGITSDSRKVKKGFIFVAINGYSADGHDYINQAIHNGAILVIGEKKITKKLKNEVPYKKVKDSRVELGKIASQFYEYPSKKLIVIGVTGTKGKTTTAHMIHDILNKSGHKAGLISSISTKGYHVTTPGIVEINQKLSKMVDNGFKYCVLEVSSHGIKQGRISGIEFDTTVLTNIKPEHLDYHKTFSDYKKTKLKFFRTGKIQIKSPKKTNISLFPGVFNNINATTAVMVTKNYGVSEEKAKKLLSSFELPRGRMEEVIIAANKKTNKDIRVFVDFAHTPDSLEKALTYLSSITKGRLISVFGCAGERDKQKRPKMGKIASDLSNVVILTEEDSRSEDVNDIIKQIKKGVPKNFKEIYEITDRKKAIQKAISLAKAEDIVALLGKGHEKSMNLDGKQEIPWSDQEVVKEILKR